MISDLHLGMGSGSRLEDFRWSRALADFLAYASSWGSDEVDLVILGDLFELWQHPDVPCRRAKKDQGCTEAEIKRIVTRIVQAHRADLKALADFARHGDNRVWIVPGNHDAALMLDGVWQIVSSEMGVPMDRAMRATPGVWVSRDGKVVAEHGHQIGEDVNKFQGWPTVTVPCSVRRRSLSCLVRTWGESFVQRFFNKTEVEYPLIDNIIPQTHGVLYYAGDRGVLGTAADTARLVFFNVFQTSKAQILSLSSDEDASLDTDGNSPWSVDGARTKGFRLFAFALPPSDPYRARLLNRNDRELDPVRKELDALAGSAASSQIEWLCDLIASNTERRLGTEAECPPKELGGALVQGLLSHRETVLRDHLTLRLKEYPAMQAFVYGHTHKWESPRSIKADNRNVVVANTGAFQRLIDRETLRREAQVYTQIGQAKRPRYAMRHLPLSQLPACYSAVFVRPAPEQPLVELANWRMLETDPTGVLVPSCSPACAPLNDECRDSTGSH